MVRLDRLFHWAVPGIWCAMLSHVAWGSQQHHCCKFDACAATLDVMGLGHSLQLSVGCVSSSFVSQGSCDCVSMSTLLPSSPWFQCVLWCDVPMFPGAPSALSGETVEHDDVCLLDAPPSAWTACETDLHGSVSIDFVDSVCISGCRVLLVAILISFALGVVTKCIWVLGSLPHCCAAPVVWLCFSFFLLPWFVVVSAAALCFHTHKKDSASCTAATAAAFLMCFVVSFQLGPKI